MKTSFQMRTLIMWVPMLWNGHKSGLHEIIVSSEANAKDQGDGSVNEVLAEFNSQAFISSTLGRWGQMELWNFLASTVGKPLFNERPGLKDKRGCHLKNDTWSWPLTSICTDTCVHMHPSIQEHTHLCIIKSKVKTKLKTWHSALSVK